MPNPNVGLAAAADASCDPGYYLKDGVCTDCGQKYYCPGGTSDRISCASTVPAGVRQPDTVYSHTDGTWTDRIHARGPEDCTCAWDESDETRTNFFYESQCRYGPVGTEYTRYFWCRPGYYATNPLNRGEWYTACAPCTNGPEHSHYTSYSTPSVMYAVESNCPWECDAGYGRVGDRCEPLCTVSGAIHAGDYAAPLFPVRHTSPSLAIGIGGTVCYGNLTPGAGNGINIRVSGTAYHME